MLHKVKKLKGCRVTYACGALALVTWAAAFGAGWYALLQYDFSTTDVAPGSQLAAWPDASSLPRRSGEPTIVVFVHPKCPCSPATLEELDHILASSTTESRPPRVLMVAVTPGVADASWTDTPVIHQAAALAGAEVCFDRGGFEADRFGAHDSGTVLYFDAAGRRRFSGGITVARGQAGASRSGAALAQVLSNTLDAAPPFPAFGCHLFQGTSSPSSPAVPNEAPGVEATSNCKRDAFRSHAETAQANL